ncbi:MAG: hypothetical protein ACTHM0_13295 [Sphingomonas sp.]
MQKMREYLGRRLNQRSFWIGVSTAIAAAAVLPSPWCYISFVVGTMASLVPDGSITGGAQ